ncbi:MAG: hypothetical protein WBA93_34175, partial [Microcoleaceae cyanobacterium]
PLTVIGQVWIKELLIKDILDGWQINNVKPQTNFTSPFPKSAEDSEDSDNQVDSTTNYEVA